MQCGVGSALAAWARFGVDRAARQLLGSPLQRIETFGSYSCRNVAGSQRRSAHATAGAIDISAFVLADGRRIGCVQIAGLVARRILCWVVPGRKLDAGERFGLIRFGSRVDVYFPKGTAPKVALGQRCVAGETILGFIGDGTAAVALTQ